MSKKYGTIKGKEKKIPERELFYEEFYLIDEDKCLYKSIVDNGIYYSGKGSKAFRELFGEVKDVRQKMLHGTERLSLITRKSEFLQNLVDDSAKRIADGIGTGVKGAGRGYFYGTKLQAERALGNIPVKKYEPGPYSGQESLLAAYDNYYLQHFKK